ncbi:MAG TPA: SPOR domain-containing protein [Vicinamibacterales bacterium]|nr:SPOR domain-containing protein [Vicinamibacterales bacterium]
MLSSRAQKPEVSGQQYAVVLVNEEQLNQLMRRPAMRQVNSRILTQDAYSRYEKLKRRTTTAAILLLVLVAGGLAWVFVPQPAMASMFDWSKPPAIPALFTGASFSVTIASLDSADGANVAASRVRNLGLPAFTRRSPGKYQVYQAMVGPFASLDEAEKAQRNLAGLGYRAARIFVDESLRTAARGDQPIVDPSATNPGVLLLGAPDRVSLVFELQSEPRQVNSSRPDGTTLQIDAGPMVLPAQPQHWSAPDGVHLLHTVSIETLSAQGSLNYVRAKVALPEFAKANVRTEGRRVYVDLTWPVDGENARAPRRMTVIQEGSPGGAAPAESGSVSAAAKPGAPTASGEEERYRADIEPIHQRIREVRPFYLSAVQSGSHDVYAAIDQTFASLEASISAVKVPTSEVFQHQLLLQATQAARQGLAPAFAGDRLAHAQKTLVLFDGAMAAPVVVAEP